VPPEADHLMANVDTALKQKVFDIPQAQRKANVHHHYKPNYLGRGIEALEWVFWFAASGNQYALPSPPQSATGAVSLTRPRAAIIVSRAPLAMQ